MDIKTLREQIAGLPDTAQVKVNLSGIPWGIDSISYNLVPAAAPGTGGRVLQPVLSINVDFDSGSM
jgi:hypothetical protein